MVRPAPPGTLLSPDSLPRNPPHFILFPTAVVSSRVSTPCSPPPHLSVNEINCHGFLSQQTPAAYTMISDLFPASTRGTANSIYASGVYLGGALASLSLVLNGESRRSVSLV